MTGAHLSSDGLAFSSVAELHKILRRGDVSPVELTRLFLDRLEAIGPRYNAIANLTAERALADVHSAVRPWQ